MQKVIVASILLMSTAAVARPLRALVPKQIGCEFEGGVTTEIKVSPGADEYNRNGVGTVMQNGQVVASYTNLWITSGSDFTIRVSYPQNGKPLQLIRVRPAEAAGGNRVVAEYRFGKPNGTCALVY